MVKANKVSTFFITINTNVSDYDKQKLKSVYKDFYKDIRQFIIFNKAGDDLTKIQDISGKASIEVGEKYKRIHLHSMIKIIHNSNIHLNRNMMYSWFEERLGIPVYIDKIRFVPDTISTIKEYIDKEGLTFDL